MGTPALLGSQDEFDPQQRQKRGLFQSLLAASGPQPALNSGSTGAPISHRIEDDPRQHVPSMDAAGSLEDLESRVGTTAAPQYRPAQPDDHMADLERQYREASQPQEQQPLSLKRKIGLGLISALGGGAGVARGLENRNQRFDRQQALRQQRSESLLSQIERERQMDEQERGLSERLGVQERGENLRAQMTRDAQEAQNQRLIETIQNQNQMQQAGFQQADRRQAESEAARAREDALNRQTQLQIAGMREANQGTMQLAEDKQGNPVLFNTKTGEVRPAPNVQKSGTYQKTYGAAEAANQYANDYMAAGKFTGPGDEALMEKYFELAKPSSGFRMTQAQIEMLNRARSLMGGLSAKAKHYLTPEAPYFSDEQRRQIVATMSMLGDSKGVPNTAGGGLQPPGPVQPNMKWQHRTMNGKTEWRQVPAQ